MFLINQYVQSNLLQFLKLTTLFIVKNSSVHITIFEYVSKEPEIQCEHLLTALVMVACPISTLGKGSKNSC